MYYKKKCKKKKKCLGGTYRYSKSCKAFGGLTSSEMEALCGSVQIREKKYKVILTVY